jgi:adenylate cyclase
VASPKKSALFRLRWLLLAPIPVAWCVIAHLGLLGFLENKVIDWRFRYRGPINAPIKVIYVNVDSLSLDGVGGIGGWPWSREYFATVARTLTERAGVRAIGMDFLFSDDGVAESVDEDKLVSGNRALGKYLRTASSVVIGASYTAMDFRDINGRKRIREFPDVTRPDLPSLRQIEPPELPSFSIGSGRKFAPPGVALIDTVNAETRWVMLYAPTSARTYYAMAVELARIYYGVERDDIKVEDGHMDLVRPDGTLATSIPLYRRQMVEINWFSKWADASRNPWASFSDVYEYAKLLDSDKPDERHKAEEFFTQFKDAVVLIGPTDELLLHDVSPTPLDETEVPRVSVHGNLLKTIISGNYLRRPPEYGGYAIIVGLSALISLLATAGGRRAVFAKIMAVLSMGLYVAVAFFLFKSGGIIIPVVTPLGAAITTSGIGLLWRIVAEQKHKGRITGMFGTYLSPVLVAHMVETGEEPKLGGIEENITAYFSDIQSFSTFSESLSPSQLVELINEYLTACTDIVQAEGGTLDKYIGDAVVAIYGAPLALPDHPLRTCVAALRVHRRVAELREKWKHEGIRWPQSVHSLQTRIGLNTGPAVVGNMGSNSRFNYTMMGDNVNIAARMESGAKLWGVYTMCTDTTRQECVKVDPSRILFRALGRILVKGRTQPVPIHELVALDGDATETMRECVAIFEEALAKYYARDWDGALALFRRSELLEPNGPGRAVGTSSNPSLVYIGIAEGYRLNPPPPGWEGVFEMTEK